MEFSLQDILFVAGIVCLVVAAALVAIAIIYFVRVDVRAVYADLSGKTRQMDLLERSARRKGGAVNSGALAKDEVWHGRVSQGVIKDKSETSDARDNSSETSATDYVASDCDDSKTSKVSKVNGGTKTESSYQFETETLSLREETTDITDDADGATDVATDIVVDQHQSPDQSTASSRKPVAFKVVRSEIAVHCPSEITADGKLLEERRHFDVA